MGLLMGLLIVQVKMLNSANSATWSVTEVLPLEFERLKANCRAGCRWVAKAPTKGHALVTCVPL